MNKLSLSRKILSDITVYAKYAKFIPKLKRRETWEEIVTRNMEMHIRKFPKLKTEIEDAFKLVYSKKVVPSMRSMQFAGKPIELSPNRGYNCSFVAIDDFHAFSETMFLLLGGSGVGFSVQRHHVEQLPVIYKPIKSRRFLVGDSIEGWADAVKALFRAYMCGKTLPEYDFRDIRPKGARLITSGGKAPGPEPLKDCLHNIQKILDRKVGGSKLTTLECHDIMCYIADAVLAGGIRRAAMISLFSFDDEDMLTCKYGNWYELNPQRARANNSVVILRHRIKEKEFKQLWKKVQMSKSGEPGIFFTNNKEMGINPCLSGDTWIHTTQGAKQVNELVNKKFTAIVNGKHFDSTESGFFSTGVKSLLSLETNNGNNLKLTNNHKLLKVLKRTSKKIYTDWVEANQLTVGDEILLSVHDGVAKFGENNPGDFDRGWLLGELLGDGCFSGPSSACLDFWGPSAQHMSSLAYNRIKGVLETRSDFGVIDQYQKDKLRIRCVAVANLAKQYNITQKTKLLTPAIEAESYDFIAGCLRGLFDADGTVIGNQIKGVSIRLGQVSLNNLQCAQRMLSRLGIVSKIYKNRHPAEFRYMPDGKGGTKKYWCQSMNELVISGHNMHVFQSVVGFDEPAKATKLANLLGTYKRKLNRERGLTTITKIIPIGEAEVFDATIPGIHEFCANGLRAHNCSEISLKSAQMCNLTEVNVSDVHSQEDLNERCRVGAFIGTLQASYTEFHYLRDLWQKNCEKDALLGVGMTGICSGGILNLNLEMAADICVKENERTAALLGINKAARVTCIKPSGTTSLVFGCSSGIHEWHDEYYIRRMRIGKNEELYKYLSEHCPDILEDDFFKPTIQAVISIPQKAPEGAILRKHSDPIKLLERVKKFSQEWVVPGHNDGDNRHNVSVTVSLKDDEYQITGEWLWKNRDHYTGITVLPLDDHSYMQMPFESCTEEVYDKMLRKIKDIDLSKVVEIDDHTTLTEQAACAGGACTITRV